MLISEQTHITGKQALAGDGLSHSHTQGCPWLAEKTVCLLALEVLPWARR